MQRRQNWSAAGLALLGVLGCSDSATTSPTEHADGVGGTATGGAPPHFPGNAGGISSTGASSGSISSGGVVGGGGQTTGGSGGSGGVVIPGTGGLTSGGTGGTSAGGTSAGGTDTGGAASGGDNTGGAASGGGPGSDDTDVFGIPMLMRSKAGGAQWNSLHWSTGPERTVNGRDPSDPTGWSIRRGDTNLMDLTGTGVMAMGGNQPRIYFQPKSGEAEPFFRDVEFTGYFRRTANDGASNSGFSVGVRAHLNGHGTVDHCLASTYYLIFRNSGTWIFDKELDHPNDSPSWGGDLFEDGGAVPVDTWVGMKFLAYNLPGDDAVKLEAYIDDGSGADGTEPGDWRKLGETIDDGDWSAPAGDCGYPPSTVITVGGGVGFIRNTAVSRVEYTKVSWREIVDERLLTSPDGE